MDSLINLLVVYTILCLLVSLMGFNRTIGPLALFFLSFILTPIVGFIIALLYPTSDVDDEVEDNIPTVQIEELKICPKCAEEVKIAALICKHCRHEFETNN